MELQEDLKDLPASTTTTTPILAAWQNLPNPCKFRGHTIEILEVLYDCGSLTTKEVSGITKLTVDDVGKYFREGRDRGIFFKIDRWRWSITDYGEYVFEINKNNINKSETNNRQDGNQPETCRKRTFNSEKKPRQLNLSIFEKNEDITEDQRVVVGAIAKHYEKTGVPYFMIKNYYEFRDTVGLRKELDEADTQDLAVNLQMNGYIYIKPLGRYLKIGLKKEKIELMKYC